MTPPANPTLDTTTSAFVPSAAPVFPAPTPSQTSAEKPGAALSSVHATVTVGGPSLRPSASFSSSAVVSSSPALRTGLHPALHPQGPVGPGPYGGGGQGGLVLFRSDLRLDDHAALARAVEDHGPGGVLCLYCFDPRHFGRTPHGFDKTGKYRARFLIESVRTLRDALRARGGDLLIRHGRPEDVVIELLKQTPTLKHVYVHAEVTYEDQLVERNVERKLKAKNVSVTKLWANTLYHRDDMPFKLNNMPDVYSDFRDAVEQSAGIRAPTEAPKNIEAPPPFLDRGDVPTLADLGIADPATSKDSPVANGISAVRGGEKEALARVAAYVTDTKNSTPNTHGSGTSSEQTMMHVGADFSCRISPWLALGCVSPRRIFHEMKTHQSAASKELLLRSSTYFELVWRDFFRCITAKYSEKRAAAAKSPAAASRSSRLVPL